MESVLLLHEVRQIHFHFIKITLVEIADTVQLWLLSHFPVNTIMATVGGFGVCTQLGDGVEINIIMWESQMNSLN